MTGARHIVLYFSMLVFFTSRSSMTIAQNSGQELVLPIGHSDYDINYAEFSPDGKWVVTASEDCTAKLWRSMDGKLLRNFRGHRLFVSMAVFSPDGKNIATASEDNTVRIWNISKGRTIHILKGLTAFDDLGNGGIAVYVKYSPSGKFICTSSNAGQDAGKARLWDARSGKLIRTFTIPGEFMVFPSFLPDEQSIIIGNKAFIIATGRQIEFNEPKLQSLDQNWGRDTFSSRDRHLLAILTSPGVGLDERRIKIIQTDGTLVSQLGETFEDVSNIAFSSGDRYMVTCHRGEAKIWEVPTGRIVTTMKGYINEVNHAVFTRDGRHLIVYSGWDDSLSQVWDLDKGSLQNKEVIPYHTYTESERIGREDTIRTYFGDSLIQAVRRKGDLSRKYFNEAEISPDGKTVVTVEGTWESLARVWQVSSGGLLHILKGHTGVVRSAHFSPDAKYIVTAAFDDTVRIWETGTGRQYKKLPGHVLGASSAQFSPNGKQVVTTSGDFQVKLWDVGTGKLVASFFSLNSADHFMIIPSGNYTCTPAAAKLLHYVTADLDVIGFDQLDLRYNRPDIVLQALGSGDSSLIRFYRSAWIKRIKRLQVDTSAFRDDYIHPHADFANRDKIDYKQQTKELLLHITAYDSISPLKKFNVWVNEVPVFGKKGISLENGYHALDTTVNIRLSRGTNYLETSVTNDNGIESYRMPLVVYVDIPAEKREEVYFIGLGAERFADKNYDLRYSAKDIRDLVSCLKKRVGPNLRVDTFFNEDISIANLQLVKKKLLQADVDDKVIIAYSGHGLLTKAYDYFLSSYHVDFNEPSKNGIPYELLEELMDSIPARNKLLLLDACHSGEVDRTDLVRLENMPDSLVKGLKPVAYKNTARLGLLSSFELMRTLFVDVGNNTGVTVISAAAGTQFALERTDLQNGVFTYSILRVLDRHPSLRISELKRIVSENVIKITGGLQQPTSRSETKYVDWEL